MRAVARLPVRVKLAVATVKFTLLLATPPTVTTTFPVVAPVGTAATIEVAPQLVIVVAAVPLNVTVLVPCVAPKFVPVIVTEAPTAPDVGDRLVMAGAANAAPERTAHRRTTLTRRHVICVTMCSLNYFNCLAVAPTLTKPRSECYEGELLLRAVVDYGYEILRASTPNAPDEVKPRPNES